MYIIVCSSTGTDPGFLERGAKLNRRPMQDPCDHFQPPIPFTHTSSFHEYLSLYNHAVPSTVIKFTENSTQPLVILY